MIIMNILLIMLLPCSGIMSKLNLSTFHSMDEFFCNEMKLKQSHSPRPSLLILIVGVHLLGSMMVIDCKPMMFYAVPPSPPPPPQIYPSSPLVQHEIGQPPVGKAPVDYDDYVILSDEELVHDASILQHLMMATKEEIEEIIEDNPQVQTALLEKIRKILDEKEALYHDSIDQVDHLQAPPPPPPHHHHHHHYHPKEELIDQTTGKIIHHPKKGKLLAGINNFEHSFRDQYNEELHHLQSEHLNYEDDPVQAGLDKAKVDMLRAKLKNKAAKLFKIGGSLKNRVLALKRKKLKDKKLRRYEEELAHEATEEATSNAIEHEEQEMEAAAAAAQAPLEGAGPVRPKFSFNVSTG